MGAEDDIDDIFGSKKAAPAPAAGAGKKKDGEKSGKKEGAKVKSSAAGHKADGAAGAKRKAKDGEGKGKDEGGAKAARRDSTDKHPKNYKRSSRGSYAESASSASDSDDGSGSGSDGSGSGSGSSSSSASSSSSSSVHPEFSGDLAAYFAHKKRKEIAEGKGKGKGKGIQELSAEDRAFFDSRGKHSAKPRFTEDGFRIYTDKELNMNKGGDTKDCPFDCSCCY